MPNISTNDKKSESTRTTHTVIDCASIFKSLISFCNDYNVTLKSL